MGRKAALRAPESPTGASPDRPSQRTSDVDVGKLTTRSQIGWAGQARLRPAELPRHNKSESWAVGSGDGLLLTSRLGQ